MKKGELKMKITNHLDKQIDMWFDTNTLQDNIARSFAKTMVKANQNKFDNIIDMLTDENGDVLVDDLLNNFEFKDITIDLTQFSSLLPRKILIFSRSDFEALKNELKKGDNKL